MPSKLENWQRAGFGIYLHWPFCEAKCPYCDFNSHVSASIDQSAWLEAYLRAIDAYADETPDRVVSSVFFGGGTPSLMDARSVERIITRIQERWRCANDVEITLEANPSSVEAGRFADYKLAGVNRVSVGIQALNNADLRKLGRVHSVEEAYQAIDIANTTFDRWSFDLIYARQAQTLADWADELKQALNFGAQHMSLYQLTIEPGTAFGARFDAGKLRDLPSDDISAEMYELTQDMMSAAGLDAYEVSNHAITGQESRHNMMYWNGGDYIGIGPGAHGRITHGSQRFATTTVTQPMQWLSNVEGTQNGEATRSELSQDDVETEYVMMALRTDAGAALSRCPSICHNRINGLVETGHIETINDALVVPRRKRIVLNSIIGQLLG